MAKKEPKLVKMTSKSRYRQLRDNEEAAVELSERNKKYRELRRYHQMNSREKKKARVKGYKGWQHFRVKELSNKQKHAIALLTDFMHNWPMEYIADQVGISIGQLWRWRNDPFFLKHLNDEITRRKTMLRLEAYRHFFRRIRRGNARAIRDYFKMTDDLKNELNVNVNSDETLSESELDEQIKALEAQLGDGVSVDRD